MLNWLGTYWSCGFNSRLAPSRSFFSWGLITKRALYMCLWSAEFETDDRCSDDCKTHARNISAILFRGCGSRVLHSHTSHCWLGSLELFRRLELFSPPEAKEIGDVCTQASSRRSDSGARAENIASERAGKNERWDWRRGRDSPVSPLFTHSFARYIFRSRSTIWTPGTSYHASINRPMTLNNRTYYHEILFISSLTYHQSSIA